MDALSVNFCDMVFLKIKKKNGDMTLRSSTGLHTGGGLEMGANPCLRFAQAFGDPEGPPQAMIKDYKHVRGPLHLSIGAPRIRGSTLHGACGKMLGPRPAHFCHLLVARPSTGYLASIVLHFPIPLGSDEN